MEKQLSWDNCVIAIAEGRHALPIRCDPDVLAHMDGDTFEANCLTATIDCWPPPGVYETTIEFWYEHGTIPIESDFDFRFVNLRQVDLNRLQEISAPYSEPCLP